MSDTPPPCLRLAEASDSLSKPPRTPLEIASQLVFPDHFTTPTFPSESIDVGAVARDIASELLSPEVCVGLRPRNIAGRAPMPEAAVNKHGELESRKSDIWFSGKTLLQSIAADAFGPECPSEAHLKRGRRTIRLHRVQSVKRAGDWAGCWRGSPHGFKWRQQAPRALGCEALAPESVSPLQATRRQAPPRRCRTVCRPACRKPRSESPPGTPSTSRIPWV